MARVISVKAVGEAPTYDLEVDHTHTFVADGVLAHNCHRVGADHFSQSCFRIPARLRLGISATPDRSDGKEGVLTAHIGPVRVRTELAPMTPKVISRRSPWEIPMRRQQNEKGNWIVAPIPHSAGKCGHIVNMLTRHHGRNKMIVDFAMACFKKDRKILVQSDTLEHLDTLISMFSTAGIPMSDMARYVGGMKAKEREYAKTKRVILATYAMTKEATDIPEVDALIMSTPKSDVRQIVGRALRFLPGKKQPVVFDIVDATSPVFMGYWNKRKAWYKSIEAEVLTGET